MDNSAKRTAPVRRIEVRKDHDGPKYLLLAIETRPDGGQSETLLGQGLESEEFARIVGVAAASCVEKLTGVAFAWPCLNRPNALTKEGKRHA